MRVCIEQSEFFKRHEVMRPHTTQYMYRCILTIPQYAAAFDWLWSHILYMYMQCSAVLSGIHMHLWVQSELIIQLSVV